MKKYWSREESKERFPLPISPLGWSLLIVPTQSTLDSLSAQLYLKKLNAAEMIKKINCYVYARKSFFHSGVLRKILPSAWLTLLPRLFFYFLLSLKPSKRGFIFNLTRQILLKIFMPQAAAVIQTWQQMHSSLLLRMRQIHAGQAHTPIELAEFLSLKNQMEQNSKEYFYHDFAVYFLKNIFHQWLLFSLKKADYPLEQAQQSLAQLTQGLSGNFSVRMALEQKSLSQEEWLKKYGHLTDNWDVFAPTLAEVGNPKLMGPEGLYEKHQAKEKLRQHTEAKLNQLFDNDPFYKKVISYFQDLLLIDEDMRAYSSLQYPEIRKLFRRVSASAQWPAEDIYFLEVSEIESALAAKNFNQFRGLALERKQEYEKALKTLAPEEYIEEAGKLSIGSKSPASPSLKGLPISPGEARASALVVHSLEDLKSFSDQQILVLRSATPTYAHYYSQCRGIISETGGLLSHGALVAREFQIPMISNVSGALELIKTGDMIHLDGSKGIFEIISKG